MLLRFRKTLREDLWWSTRSENFQDFNQHIWKIHHEPLPVILHSHFSNGSCVLYYYYIYIYIYIYIYDFSFFVNSDNSCFKRNASGRFSMSNAVIYHCTLWIFTEVVAWRCSIKKVLLKISQNSLENTRDGVYFLIKL